MPLSLPFTLINQVPDQEAHMATLVFVENLFAKDSSIEVKPPDVKPSDPDPSDTDPLPSGPGFFYKAWQFLNPSSGSGEIFNYVWQLAVSARIVPVANKAAGSGQGSPENFIPAARQEINTGQRWLVDAVDITQEGKTVKILTIKPAGEAKEPNTIEVVNNVDPGSVAALELEWFFGPGQMGVTTGLPKGGCTVIQAGDRLLFHPVMPEKEDWLQKRWTPDALKDTCSYNPPLEAEQVKIWFTKKEEGKPKTGLPPERSGEKRETVLAAPGGRVYRFIPPERK